MARNSYLGDLLGSVFERRGTGARGGDPRPVAELCHALLSAEGEIAGLKLASEIFARYRTLCEADRRAFFGVLNETLELDAAAVAARAGDYARDPSPAAYGALARAAEPRRQELLRRLNQPTGATAELVAMRADLLKMLPEAPELGRTDLDFAHLLRSWFNRGFLVLRQISWDTSAAVLEKIVAYEAVHAINDWDELRRRLYPPDRRCFAFFHPTMPDDPLIFVEVALMRSAPGSIGALLGEERAPLAAEEASTAVFYSISNCQAGLAGISFGNLLIKQVVAELSQELPQLDTFATLSPVPGFMRWLGAEAERPRAARILAGEASDAELGEMVAFYLLHAKRESGFPVDPVARFHLGNGAIVAQVHVGGDLSDKGRAQSGGVMVSYLYAPERTERNHEAFTAEKQVAASRQVRAMARAEDNRTGAAPNAVPL